MELSVEDFRESGVVYLPGAMSTAELKAIRETIWNFIESRTSIVVSEPATWPGHLPAGVSFKSLQGRAAFAPFVENEALMATLPEIFGDDGWEPPKRRGRVLLTFPQRGAWIMPSGWHMEGDFGPAGFPVPAVQLWALLDDVAPCGGGTLLLAGSHRLVERFTAQLPSEQRGGNSVTWGRFMRQDAWLNELRRGGTPDAHRRELLGQVHEAEGVPLRPIEVTGTAGDMFVTHIQVFHSASPNTQPMIRQMLTGGIAGRSRTDVPLL